MTQIDLFLSPAESAAGDRKAGRAGDDDGLATGTERAMMGQRGRRPDRPAEQAMVMKELAYGVAS